MARTHAIHASRWFIANSFKPLTEHSGHSGSNRGQRPGVRPHTHGAGHVSAFILIWTSLTHVRPPSSSIMHRAKNGTSEAPLGYRAPALFSRTRASKKGLPPLPSEPRHFGGNGGLQAFRSSVALNEMRNWRGKMQPGQNQQGEPDIREVRDDAPSRKGTEEPWKRPGQQSQDPSLPDSQGVDLEKWNETGTH